MRVEPQPAEQGDGQHRQQAQREGDAAKLADEAGSGDVDQGDQPDHHGGADGGRHGPMQDRCEDG